jgi:hypothetical protein
MRMGLCDVQDWADVRRLDRDGWTSTAIAQKFGMSRNSVAALIRQGRPAAPGVTRYGHASMTAAVAIHDDRFADHYRAI